MYDPHRDVARLACTTFETVFAAEKREKTLVFCRQEILAVLQANLLQVSNKWPTELDRIGKNGKGRESEKMRDRERE